MKCISYKQEVGDTKRICTQEGPTESRSISSGWKSLGKGWKDRGWVRIQVIQVKRGELTGSLLVGFGILNFIQCLAHNLTSGGHQSMLFWIEKGIRPVYNLRFPTEHFAFTLQDHVLVG